MKNEKATDDMEKEHTNLLIRESSPYLIQHAHNPVNWHPWGNKALEKARKENKPLLISIGYSSCHWCHVMERESFEDEKVAEIMNEYFVCIKVDREERPDIDQIYMDAVQLMTGRGGWPLNCFATPEGKPFYGGTYFPKNQWMQLLEAIHEEWKKQPGKVGEYAEKLTGGIRQSQIITLREDKDEQFSSDTLKKMVGGWRDNFDHEDGGSKQAPKFPLPNNYRFLLRYYYLTGDENILNHCELTLDKMARGGIYDQVGGGFARYSTDAIWKVPHFEKMLYDNAQLVSLYSEAYQLLNKEEYKKVVYQTLEFIERELTAPEGAFYSALDADSEGEEGKYYVWSEEELKEILSPSDYRLVEDYYNLNSKGLWEGNQILLRSESDRKFADRHNMDLATLQKSIEKVNEILLDHRGKRERPGLDDKSLTSWNALMIQGYLDAYMAFDENRFLENALRSARFLTQHQLKKDGSLYHNYKNGKSSIEGYLEDYCFTIEAFLSLYEASFDPDWLKKAQSLSNYVMKNFYDEQSGLFYFTAEGQKNLIARKKEITDNVIPASNSSMANALFRLYHLTNEEKQLKTCRQMLVNMEPHMVKYGPGYSNWGILMINFIMPYYEVVITGKEAQEKRNELSRHFLPNIVFAGGIKEEENQPALLDNRFSNDKTAIYICENQSCQLPVENPPKALEQLRKK